MNYCDHTGNWRLAAAFHKRELHCHALLNVFAMFKNACITNLATAQHSNTCNHETQQFIPVS